ncbi:protein-glutamate methylesterase/protein-glutamine glutaminase [Saccharibacillus alkalitolerans]|uniref:Protein-glutamate methylesterase/protein-glutamine glutaminase n=1 Tax=Saccharibacillus alkalitolerans TaxID=2705290 RepID=A0ABX0F4D8_9BACL|nr:chemotaxis response regulator protein-glutamate methylesterase [Saccharibacillus alkalitolerans]NGZ74745.1 chemotaxis response regulator protein-glutamate methylesterase [Saccharibacillus alkalitolerans]
MGKYGVLIVDDSAFMRRAISLLFESDSDFFIAGIARNGLEALEKIQRLKPDLVTMDVEMPEMDGITALAQIMERHPVPVVMLSVQTDEGTEATIRALQLGAVDFFLKDRLVHEPDRSEVVLDFLERVKAAAGAKVPRPGTGEEAAASKEEKKPETDRPRTADLLVIGCSTGGPSALQSILPRFPENFPIPVVVVQHMPPGFTKPLADRFDNLCALNVREAEDGDVLTPGTAYVARAGFQTILERKSDGSTQLRIRSDLAPNALYKPSIDVLLTSAAPLFGSRLLTAILTGMGVDGTAGCRDVKNLKGRVVAEAEESCVVYGMPKSVYEAGLADRQVPLSQIYANLVDLAFD